MSKKKTLHRSIDCLDISHTNFSDYISTKYQQLDYQSKQQTQQNSVCQQSSKADSQTTIKDQILNFKQSLNQKSNSSSIKLNDIHKFNQLSMNEDHQNQKKQFNFDNFRVAMNGRSRSQVNLKEQTMINKNQIKKQFNNDAYSLNFFSDQHQAGQQSSNTIKSQQKNNVNYQQNLQQPQMSTHNLDQSCQFSQEYFNSAQNQELINHNPHNQTMSCMMNNTNQKQIHMQRLNHLLQKQVKFGSLQQVQLPKVLPKSQSHDLIRNNVLDIQSQGENFNKSNILSRFSKKREEQPLQQQPIIQQTEQNLSNEIQQQEQPHNKNALSLSIDLTNDKNLNKIKQQNTMLVYSPQSNSGSTNASFRIRQQKLSNITEFQIFQQQKRLSQSFQSNHRSYFSQTQRNRFSVSGERKRSDFFNQGFLDYKTICQYYIKDKKIQGGSHNVISNQQQQLQKSKTKCSFYMNMTQQQEIKSITSFGNLPDNMSSSSEDYDPEEDLNLSQDSEDEPNSYKQLPYDNNNNVNTDNKIEQQQQQQNQTSQEEEDNLPKNQSSLDSNLPHLFQLLEAKLHKNKKLSQILDKKKIDFQQLIQFYQKFIQFVLVQQKQQTQINENFITFKIPKRVFKILHATFQDVLKDCKYLDDSIKCIQAQLDKQKQLVSVGEVIDEIGGSTGLYRLIESMVNKFHKYFQNPQVQQLTDQFFLIKFLRNLSLSLTDQDQGIDFEKMKQSHRVLQINYEEFYQSKLIMYESLMNFHANTVTTLRFLQHVEKLRYYVEINDTVDQLLSDPNLPQSMAKDLSWQISCDKLFLETFEDNKEAKEEISLSLIQVIVFRKRVKPPIEVMIKNLGLTKQQFGNLTNHLSKICENVGFDHSFVLDIHIKMYKLKIRCKLTQNLIEKIGGLELIHKIIMKMQEISFKHEQFIDYVKEFPEERRSLIFVQDQNYFEAIKRLDEGKIVKESKSQDNERFGLQMLEFFLICYLSEYDCYGIKDFRAGVQVFQLAKNIPLQWKMGFELAAQDVGIQNDVIKEVILQIGIQFLTIYDESEKEFYRQAFLL